MSYRLFSSDNTILRSRITAEEGVEPPDVGAEYGMDQMTLGAAALGKPAPLPSDI